MYDRPRLFGHLLIRPLALIYASAVATAQQPTGIVPLIATDPVAEYLTRGGAFAVILIILFFYRKDWIRLVDQRQGQMEILTNLVQQATKAQGDNSAALRENSAVIARLTDKLEPRITR